MMTARRNQDGKLSKVSSEGESMSPMVTSHVRYVRAACRDWSTIVAGLSCCRVAVDAEACARDSVSLPYSNDCGSSAAAARGPTAAPRASLVADDLPMLNIDGDRIIRVLANLLDNALKFTCPRRTHSSRRGSSGRRRALCSREQRRSAAERDAQDNVSAVLASGAAMIVVAQGSALRFAARSWKRTAARSGRSRRRASACACASCCRERR